MFINGRGSLVLPFEYFLAFKDKLRLKDQLRIFFDRIGDFNLRKLKVCADLSSVSTEILSEAMTKLEEWHCLGSERTYTALSKPTSDQLKSVFATIVEEENIQLRYKGEHSAS